MIDQAKLDALSVETLRMLSERIKATIDRKSRSGLRIGAQAKFMSAKYGREVVIQITNFGPKNVMGYEVQADGRVRTNPRGYDWRVHPSFLTPITPAPQTRGFGTF